MEETLSRSRRVAALALGLCAALVWAGWLIYIARAVAVSALPVTWGMFGIFLAAILLFLIPALLILYPRRSPLHPARFHVSLWLTTLVIYWIFAPLYQYLSVNTNRELVLWYMIPYAWEVPVFGYLFFAPIYHRYRRIRQELALFARGRRVNVDRLRASIARLPVFAGWYFVVIALAAYGPFGSFQFRVFGHAPWVEVIKNALTGTMLGAVSGTTIFLVLNRLFAPYLATLPPATGRPPVPLARRLAAVATALVVLAFMIYVPVAYRTGQNLIGAQASERAAFRLAACERVGGQLNVHPCAGFEAGPDGRIFIIDAVGRIVSPHPLAYRDITEEGFEPEVEAVILGVASGRSEVSEQATSYRLQTRFVAASRWNGSLIRPGPGAIVSITPEAPTGGVLAGFLWRGLAVGLVFAIVFVVFIILTVAGIADPVRALIAGVRDLRSHKAPRAIHIGTGDELEILASEFNDMSRTIRSYERGLERRIALRTAELARANATLAEKNTVLERVIEDVKKFDEELQRLNRAKTEFISIASHQLRTPLTAIKWYGDLVTHGGLTGLSAAQRRSFRRMGETNQRMIDLVNGLLNISRIEVGTLAVEPVRIRLPEFLRELLGEARALAASRGVIVKSGRLPRVTVTADRRLLGEAVLNLLSNAVRYTPRGGHVELDLAERGKFFVITVKDTGIGIPAADQKLLFTKFFRAGNASAREPQGTGLGLYIVKSVAELMNGTVGFSSVEGSGSTFWIALPRTGAKAHSGTRSIEMSKV